MIYYEKKVAKRETYLDCLRIMATFAVMILHLASQNWYAVEVGTYEWRVFSFYDGMVRWAVPVFVMISGALFLNRDISINKLFKINVTRIAVAFVFWSFLYAAVNVVTGRSELKTALREFVEGPPHLWFLFMIIGLYILVPLLKKIVANDEMAKYFLLLSLIFTFILPYATAILSLYSKKLGSIAGQIITNVDFNFTLGYVSYFVYGYYFSRININGKRKLIVCLLGIAGQLVTLFAYVILPVSEKYTSSVLHANMTVNVMLVSVALFILFKNSKRLSNICDRPCDYDESNGENPDLNTTMDNVANVLKMLSKYSFGAYLVHVMVIVQMNHILGLNTLSFDPALSVPVIGIISFVISYVISGILNHIPVLNRYIV